MKRVACAALLAAAAVVCGCGDEGGGEAPFTYEPGLPVGSERDLPFGFYSVLGQRDGNLVFSPHGAKLTLAMGYLGARGHTEAEMCSALGFTLPQADFHGSMSALDAALRSRGGGLPEGAFLLHPACGAWADLMMTILPAYASELSSYYGAELVRLDFAGAPEGARVTINQWIETETGGRITQLIPPGLIDPATCLVLASALTFQAQWLEQFDPGYTSDRAFTLPRGATVQVPTMYGEADSSYGEGAGFRVLEMPYVGDEVSMVVILPDAGSFDSYESALDADAFDAAVACLSPTRVLVWLPKFSFASDLDLTPVLEAMGMTGAFAPGADLSGIDGTVDGQPWVGFVRQKATISVDEYGTEAAAGMGMGFTAGMPPSFDANRPFIFAVRDRATGAILFLGRVVDPR